jgi:hypothetical protein
MARRHVHYEAAFEDFLRSCGLPYIAVNEHRKAIFAGGRVKSFDFVVYHQKGTTWLVDVKGRQFPYETTVRRRAIPREVRRPIADRALDTRHGVRQRRYWENWVTREDLDGLACWEDAFGAGFVGMFVFAYQLRGSAARLAEAPVHPFRDGRYAFLAIAAGAYRDHCRLRSPKWETLSMPARVFRRLARPLQPV